MIHKASPTSKLLWIFPAVITHLLFAQDGTEMYKRDCTAVFKMIDAATNARSSPPAPAPMDAIGCSLWIKEATIAQRAKEIVPRIKKGLSSGNEFERQAGRRLLFLASFQAQSASFLQELLTERELESLLQSTANGEKLLGLGLVRAYYGNVPERFRSMGLNLIKDSDHTLRNQGWNLLLALPSNPETETALWNVIESEKDYRERNLLVKKIGHLKPASKQNSLRVFGYLLREGAETRNAGLTGLMNQPGSIGLIVDELRKAATDPTFDAEQKRYITQLLNRYELYLRNPIQQDGSATPKAPAK